MIKYGKHLIFILKKKVKQIYNCSKIHNKNFSIISNNCWGGFIYQYFGLPYTSPTIGLYILGNDYVKFCSRLNYYLDQKLFFIQWEKSTRYEFLKDKKTFPIAKLDDIEIYFMHYLCKEEAEEKWNRRKSRINKKHILFKLSQRDNCSQQDVKEFLQLPLKNKICFSYDKVDGAIYVPELNNLIGDEMPIVSKYYDIIKIINNI